MIDKINFSVNIFIYLINMSICILYFKIKCIDLEESKLSQEFISQQDIMGQILLGCSIFLLIFCLIYIVIYQEIYGCNILKDLFIGMFYIILILTMIYYNYNEFTSIKNEQNIFSKKFFDIPNYQLEKIRYTLFYIQGLLILLILFTLIKELISFYRDLKGFILTYFISGGSIFLFEVEHLIS